MTQGSRSQKVSLIYGGQVQVKRLFMNSQTIVSPDVAYSSAYLLFQLSTELTSIKGGGGEQFLSLGFFSFFIFILRGKGLLTKDQF